MKRRDFIQQGSLLGSGILFHKFPSLQAADKSRLPSVYEQFQKPLTICHPFVRWWWNGDKIEKGEIARELRLLKNAGIGGVEINPIQFPAKTGDMEKPSVAWLSPEWVDLLHFTLDEANSLGLTCDLIVGSGWPFGAEWLQGDERTQMVSLAVKKITGPQEYECSLYELFREADPQITAPYTGRSMELVSAHLVPVELQSMDEIKDISALAGQGKIKLQIEKGNFAIYALVKINGFMEVINGAPGAGGPVLNHYNEAAVKKYLNRMSAAIGPMRGKIRAFFTDSMELEGANWCSDMAEEFKKRRGYDLAPFLPFILFKTAGMGNTFDNGYGINFGPVFREQMNRVRYDFEITKTALIRERFVNTFINWCAENGVRSRIQAYGRGYDPMDGSFGIDIPECETWIKNGLGTEMGEDDYRAGRAYSMINKYVSSAAHLDGKTTISCEELTNTDRVFNETPELLKIASDQSIISGVTHAVFHGFNYSPADAAFPGWVRYGTFFNERNPWWPHIGAFMMYRSRLTTILQAGSMFADIAILSPVADMWSRFGAQNEPFPTLVYPAYQTLVWEAIQKNGSGCDYISEKLVNASGMSAGHIRYGQRKYHTLILIEVESLDPVTAKNLHAFIVSGGRIFCIEKYPGKSTGWSGDNRRDEELNHWIGQCKNYPDRFILLKKPEKNFIAWYRSVQDQYKLSPYVHIDQPDPFVNQVRYQLDNATLFFFINSNINKAYSGTLTFSKEIVEKKQAWLWDTVTGERFKLDIPAGRFKLDLGPSESKLIVFDKSTTGKAYTPMPASGNGEKQLAQWAVEWQHIDGSTLQTQMNPLQDVKDIPDFASFCGTIVYTAETDIAEPNGVDFLNLGKVHGVSLLSVNGIDCGMQWFGRRIYNVAGKFQKGKNTIAIKVITTMGNYMKTLKDNPVAQYWTNEKRKDQPVQSMGLLGPVTIY